MVVNVPKRPIAAPAALRTRLVPALATALALSCLAGCRSGPQWFVDTAAENDLEFVSYSGDHLWYLIDTMGSGVAAGDYDDDGDIDLYWCTGSAILEAYQEEAAGYRDALWRNDGDGRFTDVTDGAGLGASGWSHGAVFCDYDGDDDLDLLVLRYGPNLLYRNEGNGRFTEVAAEAGVDDAGFGAGASFADFDGDGDLDLYITNYAQYDVDLERGKVQWFSDGVQQFPQYFEDQDNVLYRNDGDGTFTDVTDASGTRGSGRSLGALATDFDDDGDLDLFVANDVGVNHLLENDGSGTFEEIGLFAGVAYNADGAFEASMGVAGADFDNDGDVDLLVTNYGGEQNTLYRNEGEGLFIDYTRDANLVNQRVLDCVGWGVGFHDFDSDGLLDLLVVNGHVVADYVGWYMENLNDSTGDISQMRPEAYRAGAEQTKLLFLGSAEGGFRDVTEDAGDEIEDPRMSRGATFGDFDGDGRVDVAVSNKNGAAQVLLNRMPPKGDWIGIRLRAPAPNTRGIGARVRVVCADLTLTREVYAGTSYLSGEDPSLVFGLGARTVERVEVRWPDGSLEAYAGLETGRSHTLRPGAGAPVE